jgi:hypothetical protein
LWALDGGQWTPIEVGGLEVSFGVPTSESTIILQTYLGGSLGSRALFYRHVGAEPVPLEGEFLDAISPITEDHREAFGNGPAPTPAGSTPPAPTPPPTSTSPTSTTALATTVPGTNSTAPQPLALLSGTGIGEVAFGTPVDAALPVLAELLGPPTYDTGLQATAPAWPSCVVDEWREVSWPSLRVLFGAYDPASGTVTDEPRLLYFLHEPTIEGEPAGADLTTDHGLALGDTRERLVVLYPDASMEPAYDGDTEIPDALYVTADGLSGSLLDGPSGAPGPDSTVGSISAGLFPCSE